MTRRRPGRPFTKYAEGERVNAFDSSEQTICRWINPSESDEGIRRDRLSSADHGIMRFSST